ncbi:MAG: hypothetical protein U0228_27835 [Myxococcaceae bacterium]
MVIALLTVLAASPVQTPSPRVRIDAGAMLGASWDAAQTRVHLVDALNSARDSVLTTRSFDYGLVLNTIPVVGPFRIAESTVGFERAVVLTAGMFQALGLVTGLVRALTDDFPQDDVQEPKILVAPLVNGQLGLSVRVTGF